MDGFLVIPKVYAVIASHFSSKSTGKETGKTHLCALASVGTKLTFRLGKLNWKYLLCTYVLTIQWCKRNLIQPFQKSTWNISSWHQSICYAINFCQGIAKPVYLLKNCQNQGYRIRYNLIDSIGSCNFFEVNKVSLNWYLKEHNSCCCLSRDLI